MSFMDGKIFLDTNIIVYSFDKAAADKNKKAKELLDLLYEKPQCLISTQVIQEFCNVAFRKMEPALSEVEVREFISTFPANQIEIIDIDTINRALIIKKQYRLSFWDSLVVATALIAGCNTLYSEDMKNNIVIDGLTIKNPFI